MRAQQKNKVFLEMSDDRYKQPQCEYRKFDTLGDFGGLYDGTRCRMLMGLSVKGGSL
jgi:hypothetical protein